MIRVNAEVVLQRLFRGANHRPFGLLCRHLKKMQVKLRVTSYATSRQSFNLALPLYMAVVSMSPATSLKSQPAAKLMRGVTMNKQLMHNWLMLLVHSGCAW
jgi:hypothetical protein